MGATRRMGIPQSPDEYKRLKSGFWSQDYRIENDETVWRCDLHKLDEAVRRIMLDGRFAMPFAQNPKGFLDEMFGEGTGYCYTHSRDNGLDHHYLDYRFPRWMEREKARYYKGIDWARDDKVDAMAYLYNTGTTTTTTTATSGTSDTLWFQGNTFIRNELDNQMKRSIKRATNKYSFKKKRVKTFPFKPSKYTGLLDQLQQEFDHWAGPQLKAIHG